MRTLERGTRRRQRSSSHLKQCTAPPRPCHALHHLRRLKIRYAPFAPMLTGTVPGGCCAQTILILFLSCPHASLRGPR